MNNPKWWQKAVFYQIYPRSFADGDGDGIGDIKGMIEKLDYLEDLGIDALWLSPHYPSPQLDYGYDVADYTDVDPDYGTLELFRIFLGEAHRRDIRVIVDFVPNHSSDQHPWFVESRSSRDNPRRNWYVWRDPAPGGGPPNNWESTFTGSAWEYDETTGQYYYHMFLKEQPDLNWRNPELKSAMWDAIRFWLDVGVDGFRLDAIGTIFEDPEMPDETSGLPLVQLYMMAEAAETPEEEEAAEAKWEEKFEHQVDQPELHPLFQELRRLVDDEYGDRELVLVGETGLIEFYGDGKNELHLAFNFPLMRTENLTPEHIRENQKQRLSELPEGAWPCNTLGNHDSPRVYSRYGDGKHDDELARLSLALLLTLRGTPFLYNGEEIGMTNLIVDDFSQLRDTLALRMYDLAVEAIDMPPDQAFELVRHESRDTCRSPMQWEGGPNAGFSPASVETWLPVNDNYTEGVNVADQQFDPDSMLNFYKRMLAMRKRTPALVAGDYTVLHKEAKDYIAFLRSTPEQTCLVVLNFSKNAQTLTLDMDRDIARLVFSSEEREGVGNVAELAIAPFEIYIAGLA
jgi:alpha-glucosidase